MKNSTRTVIQSIFIGIVSFFSLSSPHAETQPKFDIIPTTATKIPLPSNGSATVAYCVTNRTQITRTLTMAPIQGITQQFVSGVAPCATACSNPFVLAHNQSCLMTLHLDGSQLQDGVIGGPVVCKTNGSGNNTPDPFLCSQPSAANLLIVTGAGFEPAKLTVLPNVRQLHVCGSAQNLIVTNRSLYVTALNVGTSLPTSWIGEVALSSTCSSLAPGASCTITFTPANCGNPICPTALTHPALPNESFIIQGTPASPAVALVGLSLGTAGITVNDAFLDLVAGSSIPGSVSVTNTSASLPAEYIRATLPSGWSDITVAYSGCDCVSPNSNSCTISFTPSSTSHIPAEATYVGGGTTPPTPPSNTTRTSFSLSVSPIPNASLTVTPPTLALTAQNPSGIFTVHNASLQPITATGVTTTYAATTLNGKVTQSPVTCDPITTGNDCQITFTIIPGGGNTLTAIPFTIGSANTSPQVPVSISVTDISLSASPTSLLLAAQGIFTATSGAGGVVPSKSRSITITNTGNVDATNLTATLNGAGDATLSYLPVNCLDSIPANSGTCQIIISPGSTPSVLPPSQVVAGNLAITGVEVNPLNIPVTVLTYGNLYQGGYIYSINDPAQPEVLSGSIVSPANEVPTPSLPWDPTTACELNTTTPGPSTCAHIPGTTTTDGATNTNLIVTKLGSGSNYAAGYCDSIGWYLPAICELGYGLAGDSAGCGLITQPLIQNIWSNCASFPVIALNTNSGILWSSTQTQVQIIAVVFQMAFILAAFTPQDLLQIPFFENLNDGAGYPQIRCAKTFS